MKSGDSLVLVTTFLLTVFTSLTVAVAVGLILAIVLFAKRMSEMLAVSKVLPDSKGKVNPNVVSSSHDCPQVSIFTVEGPLFFGAAQTFEQSILSTIHAKPKVLILRLGKVPFIDTTGEEYFRNILRDFKSRGGKVLVTGVQPGLKNILDQSGLTEKIGNANFYSHTGEAINRSISCLDREACIGCKHFAFRECAELSGAKIGTGMKIG